MLDRFKDAKWYIGSSRIEGASTMPETIYDLSDEGNIRPVHPHIGHAVECQGAVIEDARLIALAPTLLRIVKTLLASWECDPDEDAQYEDLMDQAVGEAREAIAKVEGE